MKANDKEVARGTRPRLGTGRAAPCGTDAVTAAQAVTVRIMGENPVAVEAVASALAATRLFLPTGHAPCRRGPGLRVYGVAVLVREDGHV